jgi:hypothetical protein
MRIGNCFIALLFVLAIFSSCKKDSNEDTGNASRVLFTTNFESPNDLLAWSQSAVGKAVIDSNAVKFDSITGCFVFETINLFPIQKGKTYELRVTGKVNPSVSGDPVYCSGNFLVYIVQGDNYLISQSFGNYTSWTQKSFSFEAASSASVGIKFLVGTTRGAWIDSLSLIEN